MRSVRDIVWKAIWVAQRALEAQAGVRVRAQSIDDLYLRVEGKRARILHRIEDQVRKPR